MTYLLSTSAQGDAKNKSGYCNLVFCGIPQGMSDSNELG